MPIHRLSDSRLIRRSQQGDRDAFVALVQRYDERLRGLAHALVVGDGDAGRMSRVLRTAYLKAWRDVVRADPDDDAGAWLYRIVYNACIDDLRRENPRPGDGPGSGRLLDALAALPPEQRVVVVLVDREGFDREVAARIVGVDQDTFDARLVAARTRLARPARRAAAAARRRAAAAAATPPRRRGGGGDGGDGGPASAPNGARPSSSDAPSCDAPSSSAPSPDAPSSSDAPSPDAPSLPSPDAGDGSRPAPAAGDGPTPSPTGPATDPAGDGPTPSPTDPAAEPPTSLAPSEDPPPAGAAGAGDAPGAADGSVDPPLAAVAFSPADDPKAPAEMPRSIGPGAPGALPQIPAAAPPPTPGATGPGQIPPGPGSVRR